jgi:hypothetical protein
MRIASFCRDRNSEEWTVCGVGNPAVARHSHPGNGAEESRAIACFFVGGDPVMRRAVVVLAMSTVAIAGCGSSSPSTPKAAPGTVLVTPGSEAGQNPNALVAASYSKMSAQKSAKLDLNFQLTAASTTGSGTDIHFTGSGAQDFVAKKATLTIDSPTGQKIEERLIGKTVYVKLPPAATASAPALRGKTWLKTDLDKAAQSAGLGSTGDSTSDPTQVLQLLSSVSNGVTKVGPEKVRGTDTTHYRAIIDLDKVGAKEGNSSEQTARLKQLLGTSSYPVDVWVDAAGLPHRLQFNMPVPAAATGPNLKNAKMTATEEFYDFGTPVSVETPPASQTADALALSGSGGASKGTAHA